MIQTAHIQGYRPYEVVTTIHLILIYNYKLAIHNYSPAANPHESSRHYMVEIKSAQTTIYITVCFICRDHNLERGQWHHQMQLPFFFYDIVNTRTTSALLLR